MVQIICLANSWKLEERCIAGINPITSQWIRPVCSLYPNDGRVPFHIRRTQNQEPALLDILEIPLEQTGPDFGFESENLSIAAGAWQRVGQAQVTDLLKYCQGDSYILHNSHKYVSVSYLQSLPFHERRTLQLVYAKQLSIESVPKAQGGTTWKGTLIAPTGEKLTGATITDPVFSEQLLTGYRPQNPCIVTVSLSMPYRPSEDWQGSDPCWKLIAGVIELSNSELILVEMQRLGWSLDQGKKYLQQTYNKRSRQQLTDTEKSEFLTYLKSLPTPAQ